LNFALATVRSTKDLILEIHDSEEPC